MSDVIYVQLDIVYSINHQLNETISRISHFFETVKSKVIISLFETVRLSVSISPRNLYNSLKSIKERFVIVHFYHKSCTAVIPISLPVLSTRSVNQHIRKNIVD